jgi:hypothetical protein
MFRNKIERGCSDLCVEIENDPSTGIPSTYCCDNNLCNDSISNHKRIDSIKKLFTTILLSFIFLF